MKASAKIQKEMNNDEDIIKAIDFEHMYPINKEIIQEAIKKETLHEGLCQ